MIITLSALNFIRRTIQVLFSSLFISINSYLLNLWSIADIDSNVIETKFFKIVKNINKEHLYQKVFDISSEIKDNILNESDIKN